MRCAVLVLILALGFSACRNVETPDLPDFLKGDASPQNLDLPGQYLGSGDQTPRTAKEAAQVQQSAAELRALAVARRREGDAVWARAEAATDLGTKADLYDDLADDYPEHPNAAEARYRNGLYLWRQKDWVASFAAFKEYMDIAPVNPHLADIETMLYHAGTAYIDEDRGLFGTIGDDDSEGLEMLRYLASHFPAGTYADDALLRLGRYYQADDDHERAMLYYKELLIRYPDSEWSFEARRQLGETYASRDVGAPYHAGFVDRDPRESVPDDPKAKAHAGPVKGSLELALKEYDAYLERIRRDPGRQAEYARQVAQVEADKRRIREELARKDEAVAAWYASQGRTRAAEVYRRSAARWRGATNVAAVPDVTAPSARSPAPTTAARPLPPTTQPTAPTRPPLPPATSQASPRAGSSARVPPPPPPPAWPPNR